LREADGGVEGGEGFAFFVAGDEGVVDVEEVGELGDGELQALAVVGQSYAKLPVLHGCSLCADSRQESVARFDIKRVH
jgi:hypothetical protein